MSQLIEAHQWVYVVIQDPGKDEQYLGQHEAEEDRPFLPVFMEKDHALMCMNLLVKDPRRKYEVQAVMFEDLAAHAKTAGFRLYVLDGVGKIQEKISP